MVDHLYRHRGYFSAQSLNECSQPTKPFFGLGDVAFGASHAAPPPETQADSRFAHLHRSLQYLFPRCPNSARIEQAAQRFA